MMIHCEKDHLASAHQVEHEIVVHHEFAQVVSFREELAQCLGSGVRFRRSHRPGQERSTGFRESAERGNHVVEETVEKPPEPPPEVKIEAPVEKPVKKIDRTDTIDPFKK